MPVPPGRHTDWPWIVSWVPRSWTAFNGKLPKKIIGNVADGEHFDIPAPGHWVLTWPLYFAVRFKSGVYFRIGARWDYNGQYFQFPSFKVGKYEQ